jgi:inorganic pyrophosphatase
VTDANERLSVASGSKSLNSYPSAWDAADVLVRTSRIVIDRPKGSMHPRFPETTYPLDYGYLDGTTGGDGEGIDVWLGSERSAEPGVTAMACTFDLQDRDAEVKLLVDCTPEEAQVVLAFHNDGSMRAILVPRPAPARAPEEP